MMPAAIEPDDELTASSNRCITRTSAARSVNEQHTIDTTDIARAHGRPAYEPAARAHSRCALTATALS